MHGCTRAIGQRHAHSHGACLCQSCAHSSCVPARAGVPNASKCEGHRQNRQEAQEAGYRRELRSCGLLGPLAPGPSFCWGPALEGPTSPSSSCSSTPSKLDKIDAGCAARAPCTPPARAPATPPAPRADPTPSRRRALTPLCSAARAGTNYLSRRGAEEDPPHNLRRADDPPTGRRCRRRPRRRPRRRLRPRRPRRRPLLRAVVLAKIHAL